jgi:hypothetical protein
MRKIIGTFTGLAWFLAHLNFGDVKISVLYQTVADLKRKLNVGAMGIRGWLIG